MARVYLANAPKLKAKLEGLRKQTAINVRPALAEAAEKIATLARNLVPVESGALRDSIGWTFGDKPAYSQSLATFGSGEYRVTIYVGNSKVRYAHMVEFGTSPHVNAGMFAGSMNPGARKQPFFFPAYRALRKEAKRIIRKAIREAVVREARR